MLEYDEPGTFTANQPLPATLSYLIVTRREDGAVQTITQQNVGLNNRGDGTATIPRRCAVHPVPHKMSILFSALFLWKFALFLWNLYRATQALGPHATVNVVYGIHNARLKQ
jgi:hypothetical protein